MNKDEHNGFNDIFKGIFIDSVRLDNEYNHLKSFDVVNKKSGLTVNLLIKSVIGA